MDCADQRSATNPCKSVQDERSRRKRLSTRIRDRRNSDSSLFCKKQKQSKTFNQIKLDVFFHTLRPKTPVNYSRRDVEYNYHIGEFGVIFDSTTRLERMEAGYEVAARTPLKAARLRRKDAKMDVVWQDTTKSLLEWSVMGSEERVTRRHPFR